MQDCISLLCVRSCRFALFLKEHICIDTHEISDYTSGQKEDRAPVMADPPQTLLQMPMQIWLKVCRFLKLDDMSLLYSTHPDFPNFSYACEHHLQRSLVTFSLEPIISHGRKCDKLCRSDLEVFKRLGQFFRRVHFDTFSFLIEKDTFNCLMEHLVHPSCALTSLLVKARENISYSFVMCHRKSGKNWLHLLHNCVTDNRDVQLSLFICEPPLCILSDDFRQFSPFDLQSHFITSIELLVRRLGFSFLYSIPRGKTKPHMIVFLSAFSNLRKLSLSLHLVNNTLLSHLAHTHTTLTELASHAVVIFFANICEDVSDDAWNGLTAAIPLLRVTCNVSAQYVRKGRTSVLDKVFKQSTPISSITAKDFNKRDVCKLLEWSKTFTSIQEIKFVSTIEAGDQLRPMTLNTAVMDTVDESTVLRYSQHKLQDGDHHPTGRCHKFTFTSIGTSVS